MVLMRMIFATSTIELLRQTFDGLLISDVNWSPRSSDWTPLDYFLWGVVKEKCYVDKPETIAILEANIHDAIAKIRPLTLENIYENSSDGLRYCEDSGYSHLNEIILNF